LALFRQRVGHALSAFKGGNLANQAAFDHAFQAIAQNVRGNALWGLREVAKPAPSQEKITNHQKAPAITEEIQRARNGTGRPASKGLGHGTKVGLNDRFTKPYSLAFCK
jgi:hypothetical protein